MKALIIDYDGTLARENKTVSKENIIALQKIIDGGGKVALCTGRATPSAKKIIKEQLYMIKCCLATYEGCEIFSEDGKLISGKILTKTDLLELTETAKKLDIGFLTYTDKVIFESKNAYNEYYLGKVKMDYLAVGDMKEYIERENLSSPKFMYIDDVTKIDSYETELINRYSGRFEIARSHTNLIDVTPKDANKGLAVKELCKLWGIAEKECVCVGDEMNDIEMFKVAGVGVAMQNATERVKEFADTVSERTNEQSVVTEIYERYFK